MIFENVQVVTDEQTYDNVDVETNDDWTVITTKPYFDWEGEKITIPNENIQKIIEKK